MTLIGHVAALAVASLCFTSIAAAQAPVSELEGLVRARRG